MGLNCIQLWRVGGGGSSMTHSALHIVVLLSRAHLYLLWCIHVCYPKKYNSVVEWCHKYLHDNTKLCMANLCQFSANNVIDCFTLSQIVQHKILHKCFIIIALTTWTNTNGILIIHVLICIKHLCLEYHLKWRIYNNSTGSTPHPMSD